MGNKIYFSGLFIIVGLSSLLGGELAQASLIGAIVMAIGLALMWIDK